MKALYAPMSKFADFAELIAERTVMFATRRKHETYLILTQTASFELHAYQINLANDVFASQHICYCDTLNEALSVMTDKLKETPLFAE